MTRKGPVHLYRGSAYFLLLACESVRMTESQAIRFSTEWDHVTCKRCLAHKPKSDAERAALAKLQDLK